ncbi:MAG: DegT/DnrJ/EryC1/StrS family aminotransferase [Candidatus Kapaibacteriales bacterium]
MEHGSYVFGPEIHEMEARLAEYAGAKHCLSCGSGTDALLIPLMAMGIGPGDAVFCPSFTFVATAEVVSLAGATPVFVDIDERTFNMSASSLEKAIEDVLSKGELTPKVVMPVDLFGQSADYDEIEAICQKYGLQLIEDLAQGLGGSYKGKRNGSFGKVGGTSFYPAKPLGAYGDAGAIFTSDDELCDTMKSIRVHGMGKERYDNVRIGLNGRMDSIQAAVILAKMEIFEEELETRNRVAEKYSQHLNGSSVKTPLVKEGYYSAWAQYCVLAENEQHRTELMNGLKEKGIPSVIYYPIPLHLQTAYKSLGYSENSLEVTESTSKKIFALPFHPYIKDEEIAKVCDTIKSI